MTLKSIQRPFEHLNDHQAIALRDGANLAIELRRNASGELHGSVGPAH
jgi:hypothetical protein